MSAPSSISRRAFLRTASAAGALSLASTGCRNDNPGRDTLAKILVVGGGAAGLAVAAKLRRDLPRATVMLAEPSARHACQPLLPLVALGLVPAGRIWRDTAGLVPAGVQWIPDAVSWVDVPRNEAVLAKGPRIRYDFLVLAPGVQRNWDALPGISRAALGEHGIHSVHDREGVARTAQALKQTVSTGGRAIFADAGPAASCSGAAKTVCLLADDLARSLGERDRLQADFFSAAPQLAAEPRASRRLAQVFESRQIAAWTGIRLAGVDAPARKATFENVRTKDVFTEEFDLLHFAPPQSAPAFVRESGLAWTEGPFADGGWIKVDPATLVSPDHPNVLALGDAVGLDTAKTTSAIRRQVPAVAANLGRLVAGQEPAALYDGSAANPVATDFGHVLRAETNYARVPAPAFPYSLMDPGREQACAWWAYRHLTPQLYFNLLLRGLA